MNSDTLSGAYEKLMKRAWEDEDFASKLKSKPTEAMAEELGIEVPDDIEIEVLEDTPQKIHLVIPAKPILAAKPPAGNVNAFFCTFSGTYCGPGVCSSGLSPVQ
ncbi:MAG: NHLP leader peptide family RiPP precursor [Pseudomonadota bacterium]